jgi:hypothetical protein
MKTLTILFSMLTLLTLSSYSQKVDVKELLNKPETRTEIFNIIAGDHELMMEFMNVMKKNEHASMMMKSDNHQSMKMNKDTSVMKCNHMMMENGKMMEMMKKNPEMMKGMMSMMGNMMGNMMEMCEKDTTMRSMMTEIMAQHPEMMKMMMNEMDEKGMMGDDGKMKMMNTDSQSENKKHNHKH